MSESKLEELNKQEDDSTLDAVTKQELGKLDAKTMKAVIESCKEVSKDAYKHLNQRTLEEMGYIFDESVKCHLVCDKNYLRATLTKTVESRTNTDVRVHVQGHIFDCHMAVLQICTDYFKQFSGTNQIVIKEPEVTQIGFECAYEWMTKQDARPQRDSIVELYLTARFLNMPELINQLWYCFESPEFFREGDAFKLYLQTVPYETPTLQSLLLTRFSRFFMSAVTTVEFLRLGAKQVYDILKTSIVSVNSEMEIFLAAFRWLMYDWPTRKSHIELLMKAVRFNLMPAWYILSLKSRQTYPEMTELLATPEVQSKINVGLSYTVTQHFMATDSPLQEPLKMDLSEEREWVIDEFAPHHHLYKCPKWQFLDYELFNLYLEQVIHGGPLYYKTLKAYKPENFLPCCLAVLKSNENQSEM